MAFFKDLVEGNGKTIEQNNLATTHKYPIGTLVQFETETCHGKCVTKTSGTLYVMEHTRDCDGTPLYSLGAMDLSNEGNMQDYNDYGSNQHHFVRRILRKGLYDMIYNFGEDSLKPVEK
jgi:hypothetical protein